MVYLCCIVQVSCRSRNFVSARQPIPFNASVASVGHEDVDSGSYDWDGRSRGSVQMSLFQYTLSGQGLLLRDGKEVSVESGQALLLNVPGDHRYCLPPTSERWEFLYVCLVGAEIWRIWELMENKCHGVVTLPPAQTCIATLREMTDLTTVPHDPTPFALSSIAYRLAMQLGEAILGGVSEPSRIPVPVLAAKTFAEENFRRPIEVVDMARASGMSRFHFTRQFNRHLGEMPSRFLLRLRVREAARLLRDPKRSIKEVSYECSFKDPSHFSKVFRRETGSTPADFRKSGL